MKWEGMMDRGGGREEEGGRDGGRKEVRETIVRGKGESSRI